MPREIPIEIVAPTLLHKLNNEMVGTGSQQPQRIPGDRLSSADRYAPINERNGLDACAGISTPRGTTAMPRPPAASIELNARA